MKIFRIKKLNFPEKNEIFNFIKKEYQEKFFKRKMNFGRFLIRIFFRTANQYLTRTTRPGGGRVGGV